MGAGISPNGPARGITQCVNVLLMRGRPRKQPLRDPPNRLREWREARGLALAALGLEVGLKAQTVQRHETGENQMTLAQMQHYARVLKIRVEELLPGSLRVPLRIRQLIDIANNLPPHQQDQLVRLGLALGDPDPPRAIATGVRRSG